MPWTAADARRHTRKAGGRSALWARVANERLRSGASEGSAIRQANAVVAGTARKRGPRPARRKSRRRKR